MPRRRQPETGLKPSIIDRLTDSDSAFTKYASGYSVEQMRAKIESNLEDLFNTQRAASVIPGEFEELRHTIVGYGLPDFTAYNPSNRRHCEAMARVLIETIADFEPRLQKVRVTLIPQGDEKDKKLRFRIEAEMRVEPIEAVAFQMVCDLISGNCSLTSTEPNE